MATQLYNNVWVVFPKQMSFQLLAKCCGKKSTAYKLREKQTRIISLTGTHSATAGMANVVKVSHSEGGFRVQSPSKASSTKTVSISEHSLWVSELYFHFSYQSTTELSTNILIKHNVFSINSKIPSTLIPIP